MPRLCLARQVALGGALLAPGPDGHTTKNHRSHGSLNLGSIFGRGSRPGSPVHNESRPESPHSNGGERGREKNNAKRHGLFPHHTLGRKGEALRLDEEQKEVGDGWQEFRKGLSRSDGRPVLLV